MRALIGDSPSILNPLVATTWLGRRRNTMTNSKHLVLLILGLALPQFIIACGDDPKQREGASVLVVQQADSATFDGDTLTLRDVTATVWFSNRPQRTAGHLTTSAYLEYWEPGSGFASTPPNAALAIQDNSSEEPVILTVNSVQALGDSEFRYRVTVISGSLPQQVNNAALFLDPSGPQDDTQG